jgi:hypothetical protein
LREISSSDSERLAATIFSLSACSSASRSFSAHDGEGLLGLPVVEAERLPEILDVLLLGEKDGDHGLLRIRVGGVLPGVEPGSPPTKAPPIRTATDASNTPARPLVTTLRQQTARHRAAKPKNNPTEAPLPEHLPDPRMLRPQTCLVKARQTRSSVLVLIRGGHEHHPPGRHELQRRKRDQRRKGRDQSPQRPRSASPKTAGSRRSKLAYVLEQEVASILARRTGPRRGCLERSLRSRGVRAGVRGEVEGRPTPTCGAALEVPLFLVIPPPFLVERMPAPGAQRSTQGP